MAVSALIGAVGGALAPALVFRLLRPGSSTRDLTGDSPPYAAAAPTSSVAAGCACAAGFCSTMVAWRFGSSPALPALVFLSVIGVVLAFVDWRTRLLPTVLIAPSYGVVGVLLVIASAVSGAWAAAIRAGLGGAMTVGLFFMLWFIHPRGLGFGDVRLSGLLGMALAWVGWTELVIGIYAGFLLGAVGGGALAALKVVDRQRYPFGPFMLIGALVGLVWGLDIAGWLSDIW